MAITGRPDCVGVWQVLELGFVSGQACTKPYLDSGIQVDFTAPDGDVTRIAGFWDGGAAWKVRFAPSQTGRWTWVSRAENPADPGLHGQAGQFNVLPNQDEHPIFSHGHLKVNASRRGLCHQNGSPFFWLGDTVWAAPGRASLEEWQAYVDFRSRQGFNLVQLNALPQHDASGGDYREPFAVVDGAWDLDQPNPDYFAYLDSLMDVSLKAGQFTAMIVLWFDYVPGDNAEWGIPSKAGFTREQAFRFGHYLGARYAAYGTVFLVTGDTLYQHGPAKLVYDSAAAGLRAAIGDCALLSAHLSEVAPEDLNRRDWLDFHMFQSSHGTVSLERALRFSAIDRAYRPVRPVLNGEPCYERIGNNSPRGMATREDVREVVWSGFLNGGTAGVTYGAHGLWSWHRQGEAFGASPSWQRPEDWRHALRFPGADDMVWLKNFMLGLPFWDLAPASDHIRNASKNGLVAAMLGGDQLILYARQPEDLLLALPENGRWQGTWLNPTGEGQALAAVEAGNEGVKVHRHPWAGDAVLHLRAEKL